MATSGTTTFNPDIIEIIEEAYERAGMQLRTGYHLKSARRSIDLLMLEWGNKGLNLWTVEEQTQALTASDGDYTLPSDTVDVIEAVIRTGTGASQADYTIERISVATWAHTVNKASTGRPLQYWVNRTSPPVLNLWPVPDASQSYTLVYWRLRQMEEAGTATNTLDMPARFLPALISGLAFHLALKSPDPQVRAQSPALKQMYDQDFMLAADEDRDRSSFYMRPRIYPV